jgi:hypothetical protein
LMELARRIPELTVLRLEGLRASGMMTLQERNSVKQAYKTEPRKGQQPAEEPQKLSLTTADIKALLIKLNGRTPLLEKDWIPELIRVIRG